jgi:hypothetical protein
MATVTVPEEDTRVQLEEAHADVDGARVALVDAAGGALSEMLTAAVRRTGPDSFEIVEPRSFVFTRLRYGIVVGLAVYVGDWRGMLDVGPHRMTRPEDVFHVSLPGWVA